MKAKRYITGLVGFPIVAVFLVLGNKYVIDVTFALVAVVSLYEYYHALKIHKKPMVWLGYLACCLIGLIHVLPVEYLVTIIGISLPVSVLILFLHAIISNNKINIVDISLTLFGICYIVLFLLFMPLIMAGENGKLMVWYAIFAAWGTDTFAYIVGSKIGKHKFTEISPKKSIEGCIAGTLGSLVFIIPYTIFLNVGKGMNLNYFAIIGISLVLSILGQIGDLSASAIKRYVGVKDYGNLFPGHGGMLDRIDSVIFIAPFAYFLLLLV